MRIEVYQQASGNRHEPNYSDDTTKMFSLNDIDEIMKKMSEKKPTDMVEPKFKVGDWLTNGLKIRKIIAIGTGLYIMEREDGTEVSLSTNYVEKNYHLWTIQGAKEGDVLVHNGCTFIFMGIKNGIVQAIEENLLDDTNPVCFGEPDKDGDYHPATKEQCDTLMKTMANAEYTFDFEKKKLKKIEQKPTNNNESKLMADNHPNLTWEDIRKICLIAKNVHKYYGFWTQNIYEEILDRFNKPEVWT